MSRPTAGSQAPLEGLVVLDLTRALAGPLATLLLAGLGAKVIKIEDPAAGDSARTNAPYVGRQGLTISRRDDSDLALAHLNRGRGKLGITLDLKHPAGREVFFDLARQADVVVENFSAGTAERLGVGYDQVRAVNEAVVYCSISGFGHGQRPGVGAMDAVIQALSGIMVASGATDDPPIRVGVPLADGLAPLYAVIGILSALRVRDHTGRGQHVDVSMLGVLTSFVAIEDWDALERLGQPIRTGATLPRLAPFGVFECADGHVAIVAPQDAMAHRLFVAMGRADLVEHPDFATRDGRVRHHRDVEAAVEAWTAQRPVAEVVSVLEQAGVSVAPVRKPGEALRDPAVLERRDVVPVLHPELGELSDLLTYGLPIRLSESPTGYGAAAPGHGTDTTSVLRELLGYTPARLDELRRARAI